MLKIKCGRNEIELNSNDIIMYNGKCYQIITKQLLNGTTPIIAKTKAEQLIKEGKLIYSHKEKRTIEVDIYKIS